MTFQLHFVKKVGDIECIQDWPIEDSKCASFLFRRLTAVSNVVYMELRHDAEVIWTLDRRRALQ